MEVYLKYPSVPGVRSKMEFKEKIKYYQDVINEYIEASIPSNHKYINTILSAMRYSIFAGGKRLRPILMLGVGEIYGCPIEDILPFAGGIEMIHTYSLIHDDLPAMDNDDYRRGKPTNHKVFGEGMAVLAGDALLNFAFELMLSYAASKKNVKYTKAALEIASSSGIYGMIGGQVVDIEHEGIETDRETMDFCHNCKTGALISASVMAGAIISNAPEKDIPHLSCFARNLGLAFQIVDDILDVTGDESKLGKKTGSDEKMNKSTYVTMYGVEQSRKIAQELTLKARENLKALGYETEFLQNLTDYLLCREY
jgi:geranylgeranyl diphosphate synthase type II